MMSRSRPKIAFDSAGGHREGVGHLLRTAALAGQLGAMNVEVTLLTSARKVGSFVLHSLRNSGLRIDVAGASPPHAIVIDRPDITVERIRRLHRRWPSTTLVALDYYGPSAEGLALVINLNAAREGKESTAVCEKCRGLKFAILRPSFHRLRRRRRRTLPRIRRILVGFGGTDPNGWSARATQALAECLPENVSIDVMSGSGWVTRTGQANWPAGDSITRHVAVADPAPMLNASDLAIIGGGTMLIEAACLGVPALVVPRTVEETLFAREFVRAGAARVVRADHDFPSKALKRHVGELLENAEERRSMRKAGRVLVDGRGADRVAKRILRAIGK